MPSARRDAKPAPRPYRSPQRLAQAEQTKTRVCQAAARLFAVEGYAHTSVRQIAEAAGVSVETIYGIGGKAEIFLRAFELAFSGTPHGASLLDLGELSALREAPTLAELVDALTGFIVVSNERSAGLWRAYVEAANGDPQLAEAYARRMSDMREDGRRILDHTVQKGLCAAPLDPARIVDVIWVTFHPSQYVLLVTHAGWTLSQYQVWMRETVLSLLQDTST